METQKHNLQPTQIGFLLAYINSMEVVRLNK